MTLQAEIFRQEESDSYLISQTSKYTFESATCLTAPSKLHSSAGLWRWLQLGLCLKRKSGQKDGMGMHCRFLKSVVRRHCRAVLGQLCGFSRSSIDL